MHPRLQGARGGRDLRQDGIYFSPENGTRRAWAAGLDLRAWPYQRDLAFRHLGQCPNAGQAIDPRQGHAGRHRHAFAHHQLGHHACGRHGDGDARLRDARRFHPRHLRVGHARQPHALAGSGNQRGIGSGGLFDGQILLLRRHPVRHVEVCESLPGANRIQRGAHMEAFNKPVGTGLDYKLVALVPGNAAQGLQLRAEGAQHHFGGAQSEVLLHARADGYAAAVHARCAAVDRHQHHVHKRRFRRRVKAFSGHHGVVVINDALAVGRVQVACLEAVPDVAARGGFPSCNAVRGYG